MSERVVCFLAEDSGRDRVNLRRYAGGENKNCPAHGYHTKMVHIGNQPSGDIGIRRYNPEAVNDPEVELYRDDPRWPALCDCGYEFARGDTWQVFRESIYAGSHPERGIVEFCLDAPIVGAIWRAPWYECARDLCGPDGKSYFCQTPGGTWHIDGPASNNATGWQRSGEAPRFTVTPSILTPTYHGFLTEGALVSC